MNAELVVALLVVAVILDALAVWLTILETRRRLRQLERLVDEIDLSLGAGRNA